MNLICRTVMEMTSAASAASVLLLLFGSWAPAESPPVPHKVTSIEGITEYHLDNGLRILLFRDESTPNVTVNLTVLTGSRQEGYGETGMAHLLEHMVFKGTPSHRDVPRALKEHGAQFNGTTWLDRTNYFETMRGTDENLEFGIRLEADRLVNSFVKREDLLSEMTVVRNEFEMGENNPDYILSQRMMAVAYEWHNYGKSTIGNRSDIERVPIDRLKAFYVKHYQPDNAMLVIAGNFDESKALTYVGKYFGPLKRPNRSLDETYTEEPPQDGERLVTLRRVGKIGEVGVIYHICAGAHEDYPAVQILNSILVSEPAGKLYKALVESKKATSVSGSALGLHDPGVLEFSAQVDRQNSLESVRDTMIHVLENLKINQEDIERAKRQILKERELLMTKSSRIGIELSEWAAKGDWRLFFLHRDRISKVNLEDVDRVAQRYLVRSNRTVGLYYPSAKPERAEIPATPNVAALVKDYKGGKSLVLGEAFNPTPENIEKRVQRSSLPNGLKIALLQKKTRGESVVARLVLHYGSEGSLKGITSATQLLAPLMARGTQKHNRQQIEDELDKLGARLNPSGLLGEADFTVEAKKKNLPAVLRLLGEILREPSFPAEEFDILKREFRDNLEKSIPEPTALASREIQRRLNPFPPDNIRYVPTIKESIARLDAVTVDQVRSLFKEQLGAKTGELAVVGDFDPDEIKKVSQDMFGDWESKVPFERVARPAVTDVPGSQKQILTPDKANAVIIAAEMLPLTDSDPDNAALEVANFLFGGGPLSSRLANRVRQKEGLSYTVRSQFSADARDKAARLFMYAICNPTNMEKLEKAILDEVHKLLKEGINEKELAEAKKSFLEQQKVQRASDSYLASVLTEELFNDRTFAYYLEMEKKIDALTLDEVNAAVRRHFSPDRLVIVKAGDFKKAAKKK